jgi:DNA-directed RNA polymerase specialized sigma24 family protein
VKKEQDQIAMSRAAWDDVVSDLERFTRDAVVLRFYYGESMRDIADRYEMKLSVVEQHVRDFANRKGAK